MPNPGCLLTSSFEQQHELDMARKTRKYEQSLLPLERVGNALLRFGDSDSLGNLGAETDSVRALTTPSLNVNHRKAQAFSGLNSSALRCMRPSTD